MKTIFIVDDNDTNLMTAKKALEGKYKSFALPSAARMFKLTEKIKPDLILLDVDMPDINGFEAMQKLKSDKKLKTIPVIFLTAKYDTETEVRGFELGALDFINKPFSPPALIRRIETHLEMDKLVKDSQQAVHDIHNATISVIAQMVEDRDKITGRHVERTQIYLKLLIKELIRTGLYREETKGWNINLLIPSAQLHDVGKIGISDIILNKPDKLTDAEFEKIKNHCTNGEKIIDRIISKTKDDGFLHHAKIFAGYHHEKWDGTGYPRKLSGQNIPLEGRLMAIADVYDALISERPYKKPMSHDKAVEIIQKDSGTFFDPKLVEVFLNVADDFWVESVSVESNYIVEEAAA